MDGHERGDAGPRADGVPVPRHEGYAPLDVGGAAARLGAIPIVAMRLGGAPRDWRVREVGDGNLNHVYVVEGPEGSVCAKQALPYLRLAGEGWPLPLDRAAYEHAALARQARDAGRVPEVLAYLPEQALIVMENLAGHVIWRGALTRGRRHETAAPVLGRFCAETLFRSSDLALDPAVKKREARGFAGNDALCRITEDLIFTDPYHDAETNLVTPGLEAQVARMREDAGWLVAAQDLKWAFTTRAEALLHGDLHTGSVMVTAPGPDEDVRVIDPEFAFYGPMGFDLGVMLANLWLNAAARPEGDAGDWILVQPARFWDAFAARFAGLWRTERRGEGMAGRVLGDASDRAVEGVLARLARDALGFAGMEMTRRVVGLAGVADLRDLPDPAARLAAEGRALRMAGHLTKEAAALGSVAAATDMARDVLRPTGETR